MHPLNCPHCACELDTPVSVCPSCGQKFGRGAARLLSLAMDLRRENQALHALVADISVGLNASSGRLDELQDIVQGLLDRGADKGEPKPDAAAETFLFSETEAKPAPPGGQPEERPLGSGDIQDPAAAPPRLPLPEKPAPSGGSELQLGQKWLLFGGIGILAYGIGHFLKYSFEQGWISPLLRVILGSLWGGIFLAGGEVFRRKQYDRFGLALAGLGLTVLYLSTYAGHHLYGLFPASSAFVLFILTTALTIALALHCDRQLLAVLGLIGGYATPLMLAGARPGWPGLMTYTALLSLGVLAVALRRNWSLTCRLAFAFTALLWFLHQGQALQENLWLSLGFLQFFFLLFTALTLVLDLTGGPGKEPQNALTHLANTVVSFSFGRQLIMAHHPGEAVAFLALFDALVFAGLAVFLDRRGLRRLPSFALAVAGAGFFVAIIPPILFADSLVTISWSILACVFLWTGMRLEHKILAAGGLALLALSLARFVFMDFLNASVGTLPFEPGTGQRLLTEAAALGALGFCARLLQTHRDHDILDGGSARLGPILYGLAGFVLLAVLTRECSLFFRAHLPAARLSAISLMWAAYAAGTMALGFRLRLPLARRAALGLLGLVFIKVLMADTAGLSTPYRILAAILVGFILLALSFLYYRFKDRILAQPGAGKPSR